MNEPTLQALRESIAHWERMASGKRKHGEDVGPQDCALCKRFNTRWNSQLAPNLTNPCAGCPVAEHTGEPFCKDTPYIEVEDFTEGEGATNYTYPLDSEEFKDLALLELEFLRSLLPEVISQRSTLT